jgi:hypothetical protein
MSTTNIFDTRNIIKETPKTGNRFLLTPDPTDLKAIVANSPLYKLLNKTSGDSMNMIFEGSKTGGLTGTRDVLNLSLLSATIPAFEFETGDVNHFNDSVKHLTKFSANNDMTTAFYDYINGSATSIMLAWQSRVGFKLTGEMGYKEDYVCDMDLYIFGPNRPGITEGDLKDEALMQYKILNAWPRSVDVGDFSYDNAEIKRVQVQFAYDMIVPVMVRSEALAGIGLQPKPLTPTSATGTDASFTGTSNDDVLYSANIINTR